MMHFRNISASCASLPSKLHKCHSQAGDCQLNACDRNHMLEQSLQHDDTLETIKTRSSCSKKTWKTGPCKSKPVRPQRNKRFLSKFCPARPSWACALRSDRKKAMPLMTACFEQSNSHSQPNDWTCPRPFLLVTVDWQHDLRLSGISRYANSKLLLQNQTSASPDRTTSNMFTYDQHPAVTINIRARRFW